MAIRYKAVNASAKAPAQFVAFSDDMTEIRIQAYEVLMYTVPNGCTAKVNYLRMMQGSIYGYYVSNSSSGESPRGYTLGAHLTLRTKNGTVFNSIYSLEASSAAGSIEIDVSGKFLYLNEGDQLFLTYSGGSFTTNSSIFPVFSRFDIIRTPGIMASIIEEYQS